MSTLNLTRPIHPADYEHICKQIKLHHHQKLGSSSLWVIKPLPSLPLKQNVAIVQLSRLICLSARHGCTGSSEYTILQHL